MNYRFNICLPSPWPLPLKSARNKMSSLMGCCDASSRVSQALPHSDITHPLISSVVLIQASSEFIFTSPLHWNESTSLRSQRAVRYLGNPRVLEWKVPSDHFFIPRKFSRKNNVQGTICKIKTACLVSPVLRRITRKGIILKNIRQILCLVLYRE